MAQQDDKPTKPHGDPLRDNVEDNAAHRQSDAPGPDRNPTNFVEENDRAGGRGSTANGVPAFDEDRGAERRRQYEDNDVDLVSRID